MKKALLILGMIATAINLQAQQAGLPVNTNNQKPKPNPQFDATKYKSNKGGSNASSSLVDEYWLNYGVSIDQINGGGIGTIGPATLNSNYLFPDSLCYGEFGTGNFAPVWIHHIGDVLDVKSTVFNQIDGVTWDATTTYSVDSISILYAYTRTESVTDTLVVTLFTNAAAANMPGYYFTGTTAANYFTDTLSFRAIKYSQPSNSVNASGTFKFKVPLTDLDTAVALYRELAFPVPGGFNVPADKLLGVDIQFIPGYAYALGDSIDYVHNAFFFTSYEEFGDDGGNGTYPTYQDCDLLSAACDYNVSSIVPQDVRYNTAATWNNLFIPSYAYTLPYGFEHHLISYKVTSPPLVQSINEVSNSNFSLSQNQPNPFTDHTTITYQLKQSAKTVSVEITDIKGVKVFEDTKSYVTSGTFTLDINTKDFTSGIYLCTLTVDGEKLTNKIVKQ